MFAIFLPLQSAPVSASVQWYFGTVRLILRGRDVVPHVAVSSGFRIEDFRDIGSKFNLSVMELYFLLSSVFPIKILLVTAFGSGPRAYRAAAVLCFVRGSHPLNFSTSYLELHESLDVSETLLK